MTLFDVLSRQRRVVYLALALLSVAGLWAAFRLPSAIYPELLFPRIKIVAEGSTLGARQVVFSLTRPLEEAVSVVPGVTRVQSHSIRGASEVAITFGPRTDMAYALQLVRARVSQIQGTLPPDLDIDIERLTPSLFPILSYNLEGGDPATLYDIARYEIKPLISRVPGVGRVDVQGTDVREIEVVADPPRLAALGLTYADLADAIRRAVTVQAVGRVAQDYRQYLIVTDQEAHGPEDIGNVVIANGLRVRDVASVRVGTEDHVRIVAGDGRPAALIDDAVVVTENIARHLLLGAGADRVAAIRAAVQELIWPVTTSTITTVVVFLPLGLLQGVVGQFFAALATTLTVAVLVSLLLALTVIPLLAEQFVTPHEVAAVAGGPLARMQRALDALAPRYERALAAVLHHPRRIALAAVVLVAAGLGLWRLVGTGFLPEMDEGAFVLDYFTPGGTALAETNREVGVAEAVLAATPEITGTSRRTGAELGMFATAQNSGDVIARLAPRGGRSRDVFAVIDDVRDRIAAAVPRLHIEFMQILADVINDLAGAARPVEVKLYGERLDTLEAYARRLAPALERIAGLEDLYNGVSEPTAELLMRVNQAVADRIGMTPVDVGTAVGAALLGVQAGEVRTGDRPVAVRVRAPDSVRFDPLRLRALPVLAAGARRATPLGSLATFEPAESRLSLERENQQQMIAMTADVSGRSLGGVMGDVRRVLADERPPAGVRVALGGQYASQQEAFRGLLLVLGLAVVSVCAVMVVQFESFVEPLVVLLVAPVSFAVATLLVAIRGRDYVIPSLRLEHQ